MAQRSQQLRWHMGCPAIEPVKNDRSGFRQYVPCIRDGAWKQAYCKDAIFVHVKLFGIYIYINSYIYIYVYICIFIYIYNHCFFSFFCVSLPRRLVMSHIFSSALLSSFWTAVISGWSFFYLMCSSPSFVSFSCSCCCKKYTCSLLLASLLLILINMYSFVVFGLHMAFQIAIP